MDDARFDGLIRALGSGATRRGALGVLAGLAGLGLGEVAAKRRHRGKSKGKVQAAAKGAKVTICHFTGSETNPVVVITVAPSAVQTHIDEHGDFVFTDCCTDGECTGDESCCSGTCADTASDEANCGRCGNKCSDDLTCCGGTCTETCGGVCSPCPVVKAPGGKACFWMENRSGNFCWVLQPGISRERCRALDSCGGGGGQSGGGCYKWATSSCDQIAPPWP